MSATEHAPWSITKLAPQDTIAGMRWCVTHPRMHEHRAPRTTRFFTHAEALAFVLAQPEVRRRTSSAAKARELAAEALS